VLIIVYSIIVLLTQMWICRSQLTPSWQIYLKLILKTSSNIFLRTFILCASTEILGVLISSIRIPDKGIHVAYLILLVWTIIKTIESDKRKMSSKNYKKRIFVDFIGFWRWCITHRITGFSAFFHRPDSK
jgi:uncharacterized membrane protein